MPKFDKSRCLKCVFRLEDTSGYSTKNARGDTVTLVCNYAGVTGHTCLHTVGKKVVDKRGDDYNDCKLFKKGERLRTHTEARLF